MVKEFEEKKRTVVLSEATYTAMNDLMVRLNLSMITATWPKKPKLSPINGYLWSEGAEDSENNRTGYMTYLKKQLSLPADYKLADMQPQKNFLTVETRMPEIQKLRGTADVVIARTDEVHGDTVRNNIETLFELKTPQNMDKKKKITLRRRFVSTWRHRI